MLFRSEGLVKKYALVDKWLTGKNYTMGDTFSVADAYLFTVTSWAAHVGLDLSQFKNVSAFMARMAARPKVEETLVAEGLAKKTA